MGGFVCFIVGLAQPSKATTFDHYCSGEESENVREEMLDAMAKFHEQRERQEQDEIGNAREEGRY